MTTKIVFQTDSSGMYLGETEADESPLEPNVWIMPSRTVDVIPPETWPENQWPRWNGAAWVLVTKPQPVSVSDPLAALEAQATWLQEQIATLKAQRSST